MLGARRYGLGCPSWLELLPPAKRDTPARPARDTPNLRWEFFVDAGRDTQIFAGFFLGMLRGMPWVLLGSYVFLEVLAEG